MGQRGIRGQKNGPPKKDRQGAQGVRREIMEQVRGGAVGPTGRNPNRDAARGDWDRTGRHHDQGVNRDETLTPSRADQQYPRRARTRRG